MDINEVPIAFVLGSTLVKTLGTKQHEALIEFIVRRRKEIDMKQVDLAKELGEYQSFVARLESGQRRVDVIEFIELARILNFDVHEVIEKLQKLK